MTEWILLGALLVLVAADWYSTRKWRKLLRRERKITKRWRDLYKGRDVFIPFNTPVDGKLDDGYWEAVTVGKIPGKDLAVKTTTGKKKP